MCCNLVEIALRKLVYYTQAITALWPSAVSYICSIFANIIYQYWVRLN